MFSNGFVLIAAWAPHPIEVWRAERGELTSTGSVPRLIELLGKIGVEPEFPRARYRRIPAT